LEKIQAKASKLKAGLVGGEDKMVPKLGLSQAANSFRAKLLRNREDSKEGVKADGS